MLLGFKKHGSSYFKIALAEPKQKDPATFLSSLSSLNLTCSNNSVSSAQRDSTTQFPGGPVPRSPPGPLFSDCQYQIHVAMWAGIHGPSFLLPGSFGSLNTRVATTGDCQEPEMSILPGLTQLAKLAKPAGNSEVSGRHLDMNKLIHSLGLYK